MGSHVRALGLGKGQKRAGLCCVEAVCAVALRGTVEDAAAADAQGDSQACGITVLIVGEVIPVVLEAMSAQVGVRGAFHLLLLSCRVQSPGGGSCSFGP